MSRWPECVLNQKISSFINHGGRITAAMNRELTPFSGQEAGLLTDLSPAQPCGINLDEDPQFLLLTASLQPKNDAQYGDFYEPAESVNWSEVEASTRKLLQKSRDIRLVIILMRCRVRAEGIQAVLTGLQLLQHMLQQWPETLYPQLTDEGEYTPQLRANAFAEMNDRYGLLADLRLLPLPKIAGIQVTLGELEKAAMIPRPETALSAELVTRLYQQWPETADPQWLGLTEAHLQAEQLIEQVQQHLSEYAPDLSEFSHLLSLSVPPNTEASLSTPPIRLPASPVNDEPLSTPLTDSAAPPVTPSKPLSQQPFSDRQAALSQLAALRQWFNDAEPGSPAIPMLAYIEKSIGKSFPELVEMYPPEIISLLNQK